MKIKMKQQDLIWADLVKDRDHYTCRRCHRYFPEGQRQGLDAHHIFSRGKKTTRHMLLNGVSLCTGDHLSWAHRNPLEFYEWAKSELGEEAFEELRLLSNQTKVSA